MDWSAEFDIDILSTWCDSFYLALFTRGEGGYTNRDKVSLCKIPVLGAGDEIHFVTFGLQRIFCFLEQLGL